MAKHFPNNKSNQFIGKYIVMVQFKSANRTQKKDLNRTTTKSLPKNRDIFVLTWQTFQTLGLDYHYFLPFPQS